MSLAAGRRAASSRADDAWHPSSDDRGRGTIGAANWKKKLPQRRTFIEQQRAA
jgi:hypothetical protein